LRWTYLTGRGSLKRFSGDEPADHAEDGAEDAAEEGQAISPAIGGAKRGEGMRCRWWRPALGAVLIMGLGLTGCGSDDDEGGSTPAATSSPDAGTAVADATLTVRDFEFDPSAVTIPSGGTIEITNEGDAAHSFTMDDDSVSEDIEPGSTTTVTISAAGPFHCRFHSQMTGAVEFG
jgi:plastocyanin